MTGPAVFRKRPVPIEAMQVVDPAAVREWIVTHGGVACVPSPMAPPGEFAMRILTLEGLMSVRVGDWVIRGVKGEFYPCRDDIFSATYEPVEVA